MFRSIKLRMMNIALVVPLPSVNPHCTFAISCRMGLFILFIRTFSINFVMWLIRLIVRCSSHSVVPAFFGNVSSPIDAMSNPIDAVVETRIIDLHDLTSQSTAVACHCFLSEIIPNKILSSKLTFY